MKATVKNLPTVYPAYEHRLPQALKEAYSLIAENLDLYGLDKDIDAKIDEFVDKFNQSISDPEPELTGKKKTPEGEKQKGEPAAKKDSAEKQIKNQILNAIENLFEVKKFHTPVGLNKHDMIFNVGSKNTPCNRIEVRHISTNGYFDVVFFENKKELKKVVKTNQIEKVLSHFVMEYIPKENPVSKENPEQPNFLFIVMGKVKGGKFMPLNAKDGRQVDNIESATKLPPKKLDDAIRYYEEQAATTLTGWQFKIVKVGTNEILWQSGKAKATKDSPPIKPARKKGKTPKDKPTKEPKTKATQKPKDEPMQVIEVPLEQELIKSFCNFQGKVKTKSQIYKYVKRLQKAITERKVRKNTIYARHLEDIQLHVVTFYNNMKSGSKTFEIKQPLYDQLKKMSNVKWADHIFVIRKYINILNNPETGLKEKAQDLLNKIEGSKFSEHATSAIDKIRTSLQDYSSGKTSEPKISEFALEGLRGLAGLNGLSGLGDTGTPDSKKVISSLELKNMKFDLQGFTGKWLQLIGNPERPFRAMFWGKGGGGKSTLAVEFAGYLANTLNKRILFVAREEGASAKLQDKFERMKAFHKNISIVKELPLNLIGYDYVFLDSVNTLGLNCQAFEDLAKQYPRISWVLLFQIVKDGNFRGEQNWQHNTDVEIYCIDGKATTLKSRFGGHGTVTVF